MKECNVIDMCFDHEYFLWRIHTLPLAKTLNFFLKYFPRATALHVNRFHEYVAFSHM